MALLEVARAFIFLDIGLLVLPLRMHLSSNACVACIAPENLPSEAFLPNSEANFNSVTVFR